MIFFSTLIMTYLLYEEETLMNIHDSRTDKQYQTITKTHNYRIQPVCSERVRDG